MQLPCVLPRARRTSIHPAAGRSPSPRPAGTTSSCLLLLVDVQVSHSYDQSGTFPVTLTIQDELGCEDNTVQVITVREQFKIPDGFSPNGDGINDVFEIQGLEGISGASIQIFNRWGGVVFESNNYVPGQFWDAKDNTDGTYFYIFKMPNAKPVSGSVTISR